MGAFDDLITEQKTGGAFDDLLTSQSPAPQLAPTAQKMSRLEKIGTGMADPIHGRCAPWLRERVDSSPKPDAAVTIQIDRISALLRVSSLIPAEDRIILDCVCGRGDPIGRVYRGSQHDAGKQHLSAALERLADRIEGIA